MRIATIRQELHQFVDVADEKKIKALYLLLEEEIKQGEWHYTDAFKKELDERLRDYKKGGKIVSAAEANKQIAELLKMNRKK